MGARNRRLQLVTSGAAVVAVLVLLWATSTPLVPRSGWVWSWEDGSTAVVAGGLGALAAAGAVAVSVRAWRRGGDHPALLVTIELCLLATTVLAALVVQRSGTWLSDLRPVIVGS